MLLFANIIREAGGSSANFPHASQILVTLYDEKDRVITSDTSVHYIEPLFARNRKAQSQFFRYVKEELEANPVGKMNVRIDASSVVLNYKSPKAKSFARCT